MHYLVIRLEDEIVARNVANLVKKSFFGLTLVNGTSEDIYYNVSNVCEDMSNITLLLERDFEDES